MYDDAGEGFTYEQGDFWRSHLTCRVGETIELDLRGVGRPTEVVVDGTTVETWDHSETRLVVRVPAATPHVTIRATAQ